MLPQIMCDSSEFNLILDDDDDFDINYLIDRNLQVIVAAFLTIKYPLLYKCSNIFML